MNYNGAWLRILLVFCYVIEEEHVIKTIVNYFCRKKDCRGCSCVPEFNCVLKTNNNNYLNALHAMI